ncbi:winged helix-turn-helix domain-containing protein [Streptomyces sp. NPDC001657]|uniref:winged helix-turn-helix domain-containing protein n=1 Tax=Streptomyces sp. NPDC001657 TaxID=3154522 RepID=UPI0033255D15
MLEVSHESVRRWRRVGEEGGADALRRRPATGRPPQLDGAQVERVRTGLEQGAQAHGFEADLWTWERVGLVVERITGVSLSRASVWRLLTGRLGWSLQRPERRAVERDESEIARWIAHEWPRGAAAPPSPCNRSSPTCCSGVTTPSATSMRPWNAQRSRHAGGPM